MQLPLYIEAIGLDMDYTFVNPWDYVFFVMLDVLPECGFPVLDAKVFAQDSAKGAPFKKTSESLYGSGAYEKINIAYQAVYKNHLRLLRQVPGAYGAIEELKEMGFPVAIVANKQSYSINESLIACRMESMFPTEYRIGHSPSYSPKPSGGPVLEAARVMGKDVKKMIMVGDTALDMDAAINAGATGVAVLTGHTPREKFEEYGDEILIINSLAELPNYVRKI